MFRIASIVEGHGDVESVPILLRRIGQRVAPACALKVLRPDRIPRQRFLKAGELERSVDLAARKAGAAGCILILIDAEEVVPVDAARAAPSFDKLWRDVSALLTAAGA